jgi:hypothetical protein
VFCHYVSYWWSYGELGCFATMWATPRDVAFTYVVWIIHLHSFLVIRDAVHLLPSWKCLPVGSSVAPFFYCVLLRPTLKLCVPICSGPFVPRGLPFILETVSLCHYVLHFSSLPSFSMRHSVAPYNQLAVFSVPSSTDKFGPSSFPAPWATILGCRIIEPGIRRIPGRLSFQFLVFDGQCKP